MRYFTLLMALVILPVPCHAQTSRRWEPVKGINLAWIGTSYGIDFGTNPDNKYECVYRREWLDQAFRDIKGMKMNVVRIFVFEDLEGLIFDEKGYVSGIDPLLINNFQDALGLASNHNLKLYLALGNNFRGKARSLRKRDIITDPRARRAYINNAVKPFIESLKGKAVFAIDVHNEPEMEQLPWELLRVYIKEVTSAIHRYDPARRVSVGGGLFSGPVTAERVSAYKGLGLDFYDIHIYDKDAKIPPVRDLNVGLPVLIGEFNSNAKNAKDLTDKDITDVVRKLLPRARDNGYLGALYWNYGPGKAGMQLVDDWGKELRPAANVLREFEWKFPANRRR